MAREQSTHAGKEASSARHVRGQPPLQDGKGTGVGRHRREEGQQAGRARPLTAPVGRAGGTKGLGTSSGRGHGYSAGEQQRSLGAGSGTTGLGATGCNEDSTTALLGARGRGWTQLAPKLGAAVRLRSRRSARELDGHG